MKFSNKEQQMDVKLPWPSVFNLEKSVRLLNSNGVATVRTKRFRMMRKKILKPKFPPQYLTPLKSECIVLDTILKVVGQIAVMEFSLPVHACAQLFVLLA